MALFVLSGCHKTTPVLPEKGGIQDSSELKTKKTEVRPKKEKLKKEGEEVPKATSSDLEEISGASTEQLTGNQSKTHALDSQQNDWGTDESSKGNTVTEDSQSAVEPDPRTLDPKSIYYNATPEELAEGARREQEAQDQFHAKETDTIEENNNQKERLNMDTSTLTGFLNTYGMTPTLYKIQVEGMTEEEALKSTPQNMKTSGEIQSEYLKYIQPLQKDNTELDDEDEEEDDDESDLDLLDFDDEEYDHDYDEDRYDEGQFEEDFDEMDDY